ncbi:MAG: peptidoglycan DD-metalloendopeptidase family protein [Actinobacteria bacterium]|nr:peptidoglycan DD-metalloendopeptidase family protein [Actinomycetota bacterium]
MRADRGPIASRVSRRAVAAAAALLLLAVPSVQADTKSDLEAARDRLDELTASIPAEQQRLRALQVQLNGTAERLFATVSELEQTEHRIQKARAGIDRAERELRALQGQLDARARQAFISGPATQLSFILGAESLTDLSDRVQFFENLNASDAELASEVGRRAAGLEQRRADLVLERADLEAQRDRLRDAEAELQARFDEQQTLIAGLSSKAAEVEALVARLADELAAEELAAARAAAKAAREQAEQEQEGTAGGSGGDTGGTGGDTGGGGGGGGDTGDGPFYRCPVAGPHAYTDTFGAPRSGGRTHQGIDILAAQGTPIVAPFPGNAVNATNWPLGGYAVKVYGAGGYVYNAHMSKVGKLGPVETGEVIGYVGNTGNAAGGPPHDHFEWHPGGGAAVNPFSHLNEVC